MKNIGLFGCCQLNLVCNFFLNKKVLSDNNLKIIFNLPFYVYDTKYPTYKKPLDYNIFDNIDILIIENNKLENEASSDKIINYCSKKKIKIIKTCMLKFPIYPINWSGLDENINDYKNWKILENIDYKLKFDKCINSLSRNIIDSNLDINIVNFIRNNFNKTLLFTHSLHPTNILLYELWKSIFKCLDISITDYNYIFKNELINCWFNPFTSKMITDLNIEFEVKISDEFYIERYNRLKNKILF